jgi:acetoacetyl-CoA synthetase
MVAEHKMGNARLVKLKSGRPGPCFFLVPGTGGRVDGFADLASLLNTPMPVFAIEARGVDGNGQPDHDSKALVRHYTERIKTLQPIGPYFLMGHSFGGMVVFEIAQRLLAMGERTGCLILLDTPMPKRYWPLRFILANFGLRLHGHLKRIRSGSVRENVRYYTRRLNLRRKGLHNIPTDLKFGRDAAHMLLANEMLFKKWSPEYYPGPLTLFCCPETKDLDAIWRNRVRELKIYTAGGDHITAIEQPYVSSLARDMSACLAQASEACI